MARRMADERHSFRLVLTETDHYGDGRPSYTRTRIYVPYRTASVCKGRLTQEQRNVEHWNRFRATRGDRREVTGKVQRAATTCADVE